MEQANADLPTSIRGDRLISPDVVVLGGGPAGCAAATVLARRSHRVEMIRPASPPAAALAESIPPSATRILEELEFSDSIASGGLQPNLGNVIRWAGRSIREEVFADGGRGYHTDRGTLEAILTDRVTAAGARVTTGSARSATWGPDGWLVRSEAPDGTMEERAAPWLVDATGRHGLVARAEGRVVDRSTTTLALVRRWRSPGGWSPGSEGRTVIESYDDGWGWSVPLSPEVRCFTAMVDQRGQGLEGHDVDEMLASELAKTDHIARLVADARPEGPAWACPASLYTATRFAREGLLLAGDAGSFIDPLSSFGVKKALSSGWLAGVVTHTALVDSAMSAAALGFFDAREREVYRRYRGISSSFFEEAAEAHGTPYWKERATSARRAAGADGDAVATGDPDGLFPEMPEAEVRLAFDRIRAHDRLSAMRGPTLRVFERPGIEGYRVVLQDHLASERYPRGMRFVRGVDLKTLVHVAPLHGEVPDGWAAYNGVAPAVTLPDYLTALATAFAAGFLVHEER